MRHLRTNDPTGEENVKGKKREAWYLWLIIGMIRFNGPQSSAWKHFPLVCVFAVFCFFHFCFFIIFWGVKYHKPKCFWLHKSFNHSEALRPERVGRRMSERASQRLEKNIHRGDVSAAVWAPGGESPGNYEGLEAALRKHSVTL